jgi:hypothetical protein
MLDLVDPPDAFRLPEPTVFGSFNSNPGEVGSELGSGYGGEVLNRSVESPVVGEEKTNAPVDEFDAARSEGRTWEGGVDDRGVSGAFGLSSGRASSILVMGERAVHRVCRVHRVMGHVMLRVKECVRIVW